ncbi:AAA family ATPase [Streptomyces tremellae]|uniref:LuxR family transcriptional regulator n=1 Tax=Streptomyces tremellae TaxID=1124239 RepID=A0ABP7FTU2_9ACTN
MIEDSAGPVEAGRPLRRALFGREDTVARVIDTAIAPEAAPLVLLTGPIGVGRSSVLSAVEDGLRGRAVDSLTLRLMPVDRSRPFSFASRLSAELGSRSRGFGAERQAHTAGPPARRLAAELRSAITAGDKLVVLVDDAQWVDADSLALLLPMVRMLATRPISLVCSLAFPPRGLGRHRDLLGRLRAAGLVRAVNLRPLGDPAVRALVAHELEAVPSAPLASHLHRYCRGIPAAVLAALAGHRRSGTLRVYDRLAYLVPPDRPPERPAGLPVVAYLRGLGEPVWPVAKALAVLHPLGTPAVRLVAEAVSTGEEDVRAAAALLCAEGVLRAGPGADRWRFRLPLLPAALTACLGEYERRRLAQLAVTAIWAGRAAADDRYLAEQLVVAGQFVDPRRAAQELLARGAAAMLDDGYLAERWLRAAADLSTDPGRRVKALLAHAATCCIHLRFTDALRSAAEVLSRHACQVPPEALLEMEMIYIVSLAGTFQAAALDKICADGWRSLPGSEGHRIVARATALSHLDRWREAAEHLEATREIWTADNDVVAGLGQLILECDSAYLGRPEAFGRALTDPTRWPLWGSGRRHRFERLSTLARTSLTFGELGAAQELFAAHTLPSEYRTLPDRVVTYSQAGQWDRALDLARQGLVTDSSVGDLPSHTLMCRETSRIFGACGRLTQARAVLARARTVQPVLLHLLAVPEAELEHALGEPGRADAAVEEGLRRAVERGTLVGTDELWARKAESRLAAGDREGAERCLAEVTRVDELTGPGRARLFRLLTTAFVHGDPRAATEALRAARRRGQPLEQADTIVTAVRHGVADPVLLREAYALYGDLGALLRRARLRIMMRERDVGVPGRGATSAEDDRLLATLVTEGLTNRELAAVLGRSEKSVEGRLSRLFRRTGHRSRVELASAVLTGEYPL